MWETLFTRGGTIRDSSNYCKSMFPLFMLLAADASVVIDHAASVLLAAAPTSSAVDYAAGFLASAVSTAAVYPIESFKVRTQAGNPFVFGGGESPLTLLRGIELGLAKECPNAAIYLGAYSWLRAQALALPALQGLEQDPATIFWIALICGALGDAAGSPLRLPFELVGKNVQAGRSVAGASFGDSLEAALPDEGRADFLLQTWFAVLARDMPFGALQLCFYELAKLAVAPLLGGETFAAHLLEGGIAGGCTAIVTTPVDCSITRLMLVGTSEAGGDGGGKLSSGDGGDGAGRGTASDEGGVDDILAAARAVWRESGPVGFTRGWDARAAQFAPAAMLFFTAFETIRAALLEL